MVTCIFCNSSADIVKAGFRYNGSGKKQRYKCNNCKKRFVPNDGFWKMKHKPEIVVEACSCYKRGMSFKEVSNHFREYDKADICQATVYNWVKKYSKALKKFVSKQTPKIIKIHRKLLPASKDAGLTEFSFDSGFLGCQKCSSSY